MKHIEKFFLNLLFVLVEEVFFTAHDDILFIFAQLSDDEMNNKITQNVKSPLFVQQASEIDRFALLLIKQAYFYLFIY